MRAKYLGNVVVSLLAACVLLPTQALGLDVNQFYKTFVSLLNESQTAHLELLVRENRDTASECLKIVREKILTEKASRRSQAYQLIKQELSELITVTKGKEDCAFAEKILQRGLKALVADERLVAFLRVVRLCPGHVEGQLRMADESRRLGRFDEAVAGYEEVLAGQPDFPHALLGMSQTLYVAGLYRRCVPYLNKILKSEPENRSAKRILETVEKEIDRDQDALITAEQIVDRLWNPMAGRMMCMCPQRVQLISRVRLRLVTFATESSWLGKEATVQLAELAKALKTPALKDGHYLIEGYTDTIGSADYNQQLSTQRAEAVKRSLVKRFGVDSALLSVAGMGESRQWTTNRSSEGRKNNRRIEIISIGKNGEKDSGV
jgi:outer membrane protein OmpA-like peptidoglycan-associated protein